MASRILIVDDDVEMCGLLGEYLASEGHEVEAHSTGRGAVERALDGRFSLVVLDVMLPGLDGFEILRRLRAKSSVPVMMLTARGEDVDRIVGLELGADDYLPKPFNPRELVARVRAVLRRGQPASDDDVALQAAGIRLDPARREVTADGAPVDLTTTEFEILRTLLASAGRVVPRERLMELARGPEWAAFERSVDVHVSHLRRKLGDDPRAPRLIKTVRSVGYMVPLGRGDG